MTNANPDRTQNTRSICRAFQGEVRNNNLQQNIHILPPVQRILCLAKMIEKAKKLRNPSTFFEKYVDHPCNILMHFVTSRYSELLQLHDASKSHWARSSYFLIWRAWFLAPDFTNKQWTCWRLPPKVLACLSCLSSWTPSQLARKQAQSQSQQLSLNFTKFPFAVPAFAHCKSNTIQRLFRGLVEAHLQSSRYPQGYERSQLLLTKRLVTGKEDHLPNFAHVHCML